jgi:aryl-alcohol dehydrogenase-like predicted oxidoreductase
LQALTAWEEISQKANIQKSALAYRWVCFHSAIDPSLDDGLIIGASSPEQLTQTLEALKAGPLEKHIVARIEQVWELVRHEAALDNFNN